MKIPFSRPFLYLLPIVFLMACGDVKEPDFKGIKNVRVSKLGLNESSLNLDLYYFNPNKSRLKLKKAEGDAWIENNYLGRFTIDTLIHIPANGDFVLPVKLQVDMGQLLKNSVLAFLNKEVTVKLEGKAKVGKSFFYINYPIRYEGKLKLEELTR